jgi:histidine triad (HIT) family protein
MCIFCRIVANEIPASKIYEDERFLAFLDISQVTKGHTLVIPKQHVDNLYELNQEDASKMLIVCQKVASVLKETYDLEGLNMVNNNGSLAGQTVNHFHIHLIPRYVGDRFLVVFPQNEPNFSKLSETLAEIKKYI